MFNRWNILDLGLMMLIDYIEDKPWISKVVLGQRWDIYILDLGLMILS